VTTPTALEAQAAAIRQAAVYADGLAFDQDMTTAAELEREAAAMRRAALPLADRCRPVLMVPERHEGYWPQVWRMAIERAEAAGDHRAAELNRRMRDNHARANPDLHNPTIIWRTA
jgi:hypothetical protein